MNAAVDPVNRLAGRAGIMADVGFALLSAALLAATADRLATDGRDWVLDLVAGIAACTAALTRRRHPAAAAVVGLTICAIAALTAMVGRMPGEPGPAAVLALLVLGYTAVRVLPSRQALAIAVGGVAITSVGRLGTMLGYQPSRAAYTLGAEAWIAALGFGLWLRYLDHRRRTAAETVRRDERLALARELHDVVAHHITGIVLQTQAARIIARKPHADEDLYGTLAEVETAGVEALAAMRRVVGLLRDADDAATTGTGPEQLADLVRRFDGHGPAVRLQLPADGPTWPPEVTTTVYRIVQESLTNIARHAAHARSATVDIVQNEQRIMVEVTDDAPPGPQRHLHRGGFGLVGMRERVEALGGTLHAGPQPAGVGWSVTATLPVPGGKRR